jgi:spore coat polysaccharide biosynthesis predicted glycosyltransferase SpsG
MPINEQQRTELLQIFNMPGYQVLLDIGNEECEKLVTDLLNVESDKEKIIARHNGARFARIFFDNLFLRAEKEAKAVLRPEKTAPLPKEFIREVDTQSELAPDFIPEDWTNLSGPLVTG